MLVVGMADKKRIVPHPLPKDASVVRFGDFLLGVFPEVYPPHEDSEMLAELVQKHAKGRFLDFGCASGAMGLVALRQSSVSEVVFADLNPLALKNARLNLEKNVRLLPSRKPVSFTQTDLFSNLKSQSFDAISFNPPYLPTAKRDKVSGWLNDALDGGKDGRRVLDPFLQQFSSHLSRPGTLLLLESSLSHYPKTIKALQRKGFRATIELRKKFFFEELVGITAVRY